MIEVYVKSGILLVLSYSLWWIIPGLIDIHAPAYVVGISLLLWSSLAGFAAWRFLQALFGR